MSILSRKRRRDMKSRRWQFLAVGVTMVVGVMMFAATYDSYRNLTASYQQTYERLSFADMTITGGDDGLVDALNAIDGVKDVTVRHSADVPVTIGIDTLNGRLVGTPADGQPDIDKLDIQQGTYLSGSGSNDAVAEVHVARTFDLSVGDTFTVAVGNGQEFTIAGIAASAEYIWPAASTQDVFPDPQQFGVFFVDEALVAQLPDSVSVKETLVLYDDGIDTATVNSLVHDAATSAGASSIIAQADHPSNSTLQLDVEGFQEMAFMFPLLFLTAAGMAVYVLLTRLVFSQRSIIGTLRASGMSPRTLRRHYLSFGLWIGSISGILGVIFGVAAGAAMTRVYTEQLDIPDTVVNIRPATMAAGLIFGIVAGALSALIPARSASKMAPAEAMRGSAPTMSGGRSLIEKVLPFLSRLPVRTRMTLRGIGRSKRRSASTVIGVMLALVLILASGGMVDSMASAVNRLGNEIILQDASVVASAPITKEFVDSVEAVPAVAKAEPVATFSASITKDGDTFATTLQGYDADTEMHGWLDESGTLPTDGILAGKSLAGRLGVSEGDMLSINLPTHDVTIEMKLAGFVDEPLGIPLYASTGAIAAALETAGVSDTATLLEDPTVSVVMTTFDPTIARDTAIAAVEGLPGVIAVHDARRLIDMVQQFLGLFYAFVGIMLIFGGLMAFSLMFNTISVNIAERSTEFATLKASGMANRTIAWMIVGENLLLTVVGIIPGLILGVWSASVFITSFNNDSFTFELSMRPLTIIVSALAMIVVALLSMIPGVRSIGRLDVGKVVRERAI